MITIDNKREIQAQRRIGIVTAAWGRSRIARTVLEYYTRFSIAEVEFVRVVAVSPEDKDPLGPLAGWQQVEVPNRPLGKKFNTAVHHAVDHDLLGIIVIGSDDILSPDYFGHVVSMAERGYDFVEPHEFCIYVPGEERVNVCLSATTGAGRYLSTKLIARMGGSPWSGDLNAFLDANMMARMRGLERRSNAVRDMLQSGYVILDIKGEGMWHLVDGERRGQKALRHQETGAVLNIRKVVTYPVGPFMDRHFPEFDYRAL